MKRLTTLAILAVCASSFGQVWNEVGDAGSLLPGQLTLGVGALTTINGTYAGDADLYCIRITDFANFRASTNNAGTTAGDTQLFLFNANGGGVTHNDDDPAGGFLSTITGVFVPGNGTYFLAVSGFDHDPSSAGGLIWANGPFNVERAPDGPGAAGSLASWGGSGGTGGYQIDLRGAGYHAVPEPASMAVLGMGALALLRRRKKA